MKEGEQSFFKHAVALSTMVSLPKGMSQSASKACFLSVNSKAIVLF